MTPKASQIQFANGPALYIKNKVDKDKDILKIQYLDAQL